MRVSKGGFSTFEEDVIGVLHHHVVVEHVGGCGVTLGGDTGVAELGGGGLSLVLGQSGRLVSVGGCARLLGVGVGRAGCCTASSD